LQTPKGSLKSKMERRRLAAKWLQTEHDWFTKMLASRRRSIGYPFCKGFNLYSLFA